MQQTVNAVWWHHFHANYVITSDGTSGFRDSSSYAICICMEFTQNAFHIRCMNLTSSRRNQWLEVVICMCHKQIISRCNEFQEDVFSIILFVLLIELHFHLTVCSIMSSVKLSAQNPFSPIQHFSCQIKANGMIAYIIACDTDNAQRTHFRTKT